MNQRLEKYIGKLDCTWIACFEEHKTTPDGSMWIKNPKSDDWHIRVYKTGFFDFNTGTQGNAVELLKHLIAVEAESNVLCERILSHIEIAEAKLDNTETAVIWDLDNAVKHIVYNFKDFKNL